MKKKFKDTRLGRIIKSPFFDGIIDALPLGGTAKRVVTAVGNTVKSVAKGRLPSKDDLFTVLDRDKDGKIDIEFVIGGAVGFVLLAIFAPEFLDRIMRFFGM